MSVTITDLYRQLFGRSGTSKGSDIDMSEHGRAGGISTGTPFKMTRSVDEKTIIDATDANNVYLGKARQAGATSSAIWQIRLIATSSSVTTISYADGDDLYDNVWDDRSGLSYS